MEINNSKKINMRKIAVYACICVLGMSGCGKSTYDKIHKENIEILLNKKIESEAVVADTQNILTLDKALEIGMSRNLSLKIKELEYEISVLDKKISFTNFLPRIQAFGLFNKIDNGGIYGKNVGTTLPFGMNIQTRLLDSEFYTAGVGAVLPIFVPSTWFIYSARNKAVDMHALLVDYQKKNLALEITVAFYNMLALEYESEYLAEEMNHANEVARVAEVALKTESILQWELEQAKAYQSSVAYAQDRNKSEMSSARMRLLSLLNMSPDTDIKFVEGKVVKGELVEGERKSLDISLDEALYRALSHNHLLKSAEIGSAIQKDMKKIAITRFLPSITISGGYIETNNEAIVEPNILFGSVNGVFTLFNGFANINLYKKEKLQSEIVSYENEELVLKVIMETTNAYNMAKDVAIQISAINHAYNAALGKMHAMQVAYKVGECSTEEYFKAIFEYRQIVATQKKLQYTEQIYLTTLELLMGGSK